ncbi:MAG: ComF family protein [Blautia sp.]|nr:ComF family protein [Blautia sp.]
MWISEKLHNVKIKHAAEQALDILYPRRCPACNDILRPSGRLICPECERALKPIEGPVCMKCGSPVQEQEEYCTECTKHSHIFRQGRGVFVYDDRWKASLERFKYYGSREFADFYAAAMVKWGGKSLKKWAPDVIVPVPLHISKERKRGFNQALLIAEEAGRRTGIPVSKTLLRKIKKTESQKKLDYAHRKRNLSGAFLASPEARGRIVLIVDDVYTTGSTMDECAGALLGAGAADVYFLTFCIALR